MAQEALGSGFMNELIHYKKTIKLNAVDGKIIKNVCTILLDFLEDHSELNKKQIAYFSIKMTDSFDAIHQKEITLEWDC